MATLEGKSVVVIGGSSGIGYGVARAALLNHAALVRIASSSQARVDAALARLLADPALRAQGRVEGGVVDLHDTPGVAAFFARIGPIDHLVVTSGGVTNTTPDFRAEDLSKHRDVFDVRFWGPAEAAQKAQLKEGGSVTFTIGMALMTPRPTWSLVVGALGAVDALTRALAVELAPRRVNVVAPGFVDTELWDAMPKDAKDAMVADFAGKLPVKHVAGADEIAEAYIFCMKCNYITGQRIIVDGGGVLN